MLIKKKTKINKAETPVKWTALFDSEGKEIERFKGAKFLIAGVSRPNFVYSESLRKTQEREDAFIGVGELSALEAARRGVKFNLNVVENLLLGWDGIQYEDEDGSTGVLEFNRSSVEMLALNFDEPEDRGLSVEFALGVYFTAIKIQKEADSELAELKKK